MLKTLGYLFANDRWNGPVPAGDRAAYAYMNARFALGLAMDGDLSAETRELALADATQWQHLAAVAHRWTR